MNRDPSLRIDAARAERLLAGAGSGPDPLARLLAAASSPARPDELAGEDAAVLAFRGAGRVSGYLVGGPDTPVRVREPRRFWARVLTVKAAVLGLAVAAAGVALAAGTGLLPTPFVNADSPFGRVPEPVVTSSEGQRSHSSTTVPGTGEPTASQAAPSLPPATSLVGLCRAYQERKENDPGKSMDSTAYARLVAAAGSEEQVASYCDALLADEIQPSPTGDHSVTQQPAVDGRSGTRLRGPQRDPPPRAAAGPASNGVMRSLAPPHPRVR
jgi:hypothetical protein